MMSEAFSHEYIWIGKDWKQINCNDAVVWMLVFPTLELRWYCSESGPTQAIKEGEEFWVPELLSKLAKSCAIVLFPVGYVIHHELERTSINKERFIICYLYKKKLKDLSYDVV